MKKLAIFLIILSNLVCADGATPIVAQTQQQDVRLLVDQISINDEKPAQTEHKITIVQPATEISVPIANHMNPGEKRSDDKAIRSADRTLTNELAANFEKYKTDYVPKTLYTRAQTKDNAHLPTIYFMSTYIKNCFKAAADNDLDRLRFYLDKYPEFVDVPDKNGNSILFHAVLHNRMDAARLIIAKGANVSLRNIDDITPLDIAVDLENYNMSKLLLTAGARTTQLVSDPKLMQLIDSYK